MHDFYCHFSDNSGQVMNFKVRAKDKKEAIEKAFARARKRAKGDLSPSWSVTFRNYTL